MTAKELIKQLQDLVSEFGDRGVEVNGEYNSNYPINTASRLQVTRVDVFVDSDSIQIMIDNKI